MAVRVLVSAHVPVRVGFGIDDEEHHRQGGPAKFLAEITIPGDVKLNLSSIPLLADFINGARLILDSFPSIPVGTCRRVRPGWHLEPGPLPSLREVEASGDQVDP